MAHDTSNSPTAHGPRVLVTGATGKSGGLVLEAARDAGLAVVPAGRSGTGGMRPLDLTDPSTYRAALDGVEAIYLVRPPALADVTRSLIPFIAAARAEGVGRIVFLSVAGAEDRRWVPHHAVERALMDGPADWTILRAGFFAQNLEDAYLRDILEDDRLYVPAGAGRVAFLDLADLADIAVQALAGDLAAGSAVHLTGPDAIGFEDVAALLSDRLGRRIRYVAANPIAYAHHLIRRRQVPAMGAAIQTRLHVGLRFGEAAQVTQTIPTLLNRPATTMGAYIARRASLWTDGPGRDPGPAHD